MHFSWLSEFQNQEVRFVQNVYPSSLGFDVVYRCCDLNSAVHLCNRHFLDFHFCMSYTVIAQKNAGLFEDEAYP